MSNLPITTITFFRYQSWSNKWWGFKQMGLLPEQLQTIEGITFAKMLGSGAGRGFSIFPNFGVYGLLISWENEVYANSFFQAHPIFLQQKERAKEYLTLFLHPTKSHGTWDEVEPFKTTHPFDKKQAVAVITRATIYTKHLLGFWRFVPQVSRSVHDKKGRIFSIGIGELPLIQQATFSIWENSELMMDYAYKSKFHKEVIQKTRELGWYKEELFARFIPYKKEGKWGDLNLDQLLTATPLSI